jgi:hypothetical protein
VQSRVRSAKHDVWKIRVPKAIINNPGAARRRGVGLLDNAIFFTCALVLTEVYKVNRPASALRHARRKVAGGGVDGQRVDRVEH